MGNLSRDSLDSYMQTYAGSKLRTFDKTITITTTAYQNNSSSAMGGTGSNTTTHRFEYTGAADSLFDNYIDGGVAAGARIYSQDIVDTLEDGVRRTVDLIEDRITDRSISAVLCHSSCHTSCHTSRGRR
jgi:hypothetical protein